MKRVFVIAVAAVALAAAAATALPTGLSSLAVGFGGQGHAGVSQGRVGGQFDFALPPYVSLGPEIMFGFGNGFMSLAVGAETRVYFAANYDLVVQPQVSFGGGYGGLFDADDYFSIGYIHFGGGMDFEIPQAPMAPYFDMGGLIWFDEGGSPWTFFSIEGGVRFDLW